MRRGVTLIELLIVLAISTLLFVGMMDTLRLLLGVTAAQPQALQAIDKARSVTTTFTNELRNATDASDGSYPIVEASTSEIIFFSPYRSGRQENVRRIRYFVASSTLYKGVVSASGTPPVYLLSDEQITAQLSLASTSSATPLFSYFDGTFSGSSTPLAQPVPVTQITYVQISLEVPQYNSRGATSTFIMTAGSAVRNLKNNLGE